MPAESCSDQEFKRLFNLSGATETAKILGISERSVYKRRARLERTGSAIIAPTKNGHVERFPERNRIDIKNGLVIVGSDFHIWPGSESVCLKAFKLLCKELRPAAVVANGDLLDFPQISRHPPIGWEATPSPFDEIEAAKQHLHDIEMAVPRGCRKVWTLGNHDARFETRLATVAFQYKNIRGIHLSDHFPNWEKGWSVWINNDVCIKHRWKGGIHATHNNTLNSGVTMVTGHLHSQKVTPFTDYNGTRYGIDTGCVADTEHDAFRDYTEESPKNWISGFAVLKFKDGRLMYPELVSKWSDESVQFRGEIIKV